MVVVMILLLQSFHLSLDFHRLDVELFGLRLHHRIYGVLGKGKHMNPVFATVSLVRRKFDI